MRNEVQIVAIVGKTATGKDTVAKHLKEKYGVKPIVSFTTRPIRSGETDGVEHFFISSEKMQELTSHADQLLAYTKFPKTGYEYCASTEELDEGIYSYIIDPPGLEWLQEHRPDIPVCIIALDAPEEVIRAHAVGRGDDLQALEQRLDSEREIFDRFMDNMGENVINTDQPMESMLACVDTKMQEFGVKPKITGFHEIDLNQYKNLVLALVDATVKGEQVGNYTMKESQQLYSRLRYEEYCRKHDIAYEDMEPEDFANAEEDRFWQNYDPE